MIKSLVLMIGGTLMARWLCGAPAAPAWGACVFGMLVALTAQQLDPHDEWF